ncbi:MAG: hypothetical protein U0930_07840 [Pirellulales bacterium]
MTGRFTTTSVVFNLLCHLCCCCNAFAQERSSASPAEKSSESTFTDRTRDDEIRLGSRTAKGGFQNEDEIRDKFNNWQHDADARIWLAAMNYKLDDLVSVRASKPHGQKADVELTVTTKTSQRREGISIKLVSTSTGFNQIDKRWLKTYADMWAMPEEVQRALKLFVGEEAASTTGRDPKRLYLNEMDKAQQQLVVDFFTKNRKQIVDNLFAGDGQHAAGWIMVTLKSPNSQNQLGESANLSHDISTAPKATEKTKASNELKASEAQWVICPSQVAAEYFGDGPVQITAAGNLKIGRITMQRKGGDNGRETANMLQFKINPVELFSIRSKELAN